MIQHKYVGFITNKINYSDNDAIINNGEMPKEIKSSL